MHSIERYGIVALLFLVVTVVAVLMWDGDKKRKGKGVASAPSATPVLDAKPAPGAKSAASQPGNQLTLVADPQPGPLVRSPVGGSAEKAAVSEGLEPGWAEPAPLHAGAPGFAGQALHEDAGAELAPEVKPRPEPVVDHTLALTPSGSAPVTHAYVVRSGDTLSEIAQHELGSAKRWQEIVASNPGLDPARLRAGQSVRLPGAPRTGEAARTSEGATQVAKGTPREKSEKSSSSQSSPSSQSKPATWKVGKGESLWKIAERALGDGQRWREIVALNPKLDPDKLVLGQVLVLPKSAAPKAGSASVASTGASAKKGAPLVVASTDDAPVRARRGGKVK